MMVAGVWVFAAIDIGVPNAVHRHQKYYGDTGYCELALISPLQVMKTLKILSTRVLDSE